MRSYTWLKIYPLSEFVVDILSFKTISKLIKHHSMLFMILQNCFFWNLDISRYLFSLVACRKWSFFISYLIFLSQNTFVHSLETVAVRMSFTFNHCWVLYKNHLKFQPCVCAIYSMQYREHECYLPVNSSVFKAIIYLSQSLCPRRRSDRFQSREKISRAGTPRKLNVVQLPSVSARTKADRKRSD